MAFERIGLHGNIHLVCAESKRKLYEQLMQQCRKKDEYKIKSKKWSRSLLIHPVILMNFHLPFLQHSVVINFAYHITAK